MCPSFYMYVCNFYKSNNTLLNCGILYIAAVVSERVIFCRAKGQLMWSSVSTNTIVINFIPKTIPFPLIVGLIITN